MYNPYQNLAVYKENGKIYVNVTITKNGTTKKPDAEQIRKQHYDVEELTLTLEQLNDKIKKGFAWLPATFSKENGKIRMRIANFEKSGIIVMDIDDGSFDLKELRKWLVSKDLAPNFGYYTFSNRKGNYRYRLGWVVGTVKNSETMKALSQIMYNIIDKWYRQQNLNKEKVVRRPAGAIMCMSLEETHDDTSSYNPVQLWQGTNQKAYVWHNDFLDLKNLIDVYYTLSQPSRMKKELQKIGISVVGFFIPSESTENGLEKVDVINQSFCIGGSVKNTAISLYNVIDSSKKADVKYDGDYVGSGDNNTLYSRCRLLREMKDSNAVINGISTNGHNAKRFICINLKFLKDGEEIMLDTVCNHSDKPESYWVEDFQRIRTDTPPVKCNKFCPYSNSCKYGNSTIAAAAQTYSYKNKDVQSHKGIEEISLDEAQQKVTGFIDEVFSSCNKISQERNELSELKMELMIKESEVGSILPVLCSKYGIENDEGAFKKLKRRSYSVNDKGLRDFVDAFENLDYQRKKYENKNKLYKSRKAALNDNLTVISVPVGVGKTKSVLDKMAENPDVKVIYAAPSHKLADQFYEDLIDAFYKAGVKMPNIVRMHKRPEMLNKKQEREISELERMGISVTRKIKGIYEWTKKSYQGVVKNMKSNEEKIKYETFLEEAEKYLESRENSHKADIIICTHKYIQLTNPASYAKMDLLVIDEDMCKTATSESNISISVLEEMESILRTENYELSDGSFGSFKDIINIIEYILNAEDDKIYTFDSSVEVCSEVLNDKVKMGMTIAKYNKMSELRSVHKLNFLNLCKIKAFMKHKDNIKLVFFDKLNCKDMATIMLSANPSPEFVLKAITDKSNVILKETGYVKQSGKIIQCLSGAYKKDLDKPGYADRVKEIISKYNPNCKDIITFKNYVDMFNDYNTPMYLGAVSGLNSLTGKDITVVGTFSIRPDTVSLFCGMFKPNYSVSEIKIPSRRRVTYKNSEQILTTYDSKNERDYHLWTMYDELVQAEGRARAVRTDATVLIFANIIHPQAQIIEDKIIIKSINPECEPEPETEELGLEEMINDVKNIDEDDYELPF